jgi:hypothetical protein
MIDYSLEIKTFIIIMENKYAPKVVSRGTITSLQFQQDLEKIRKIDHKVKDDVKNLKQRLKFNYNH